VARLVLGCHMGAENSQHGSYTGWMGMDGRPRGVWMGQRLESAGAARLGHRWGWIGAGGRLDGLGG